MTKIKKKFTIVFLVISLFFLLSLTGCKDTEKENAIAEAAAEKTDLTKVKADLAKITNERDTLSSELTAAMEARDKLQAMVGQAPNIKEQLAGLTEERDAAIAKATGARDMVEQLKSQLAEQIQKVIGLEGQNKKLQEMIDELKKNLGSEVKMPSIPKF